MKHPMRPGAKLQRDPPPTNLPSTEQSPDAARSDIYTEKDVEKQIEGANTGANDYGQPAQINYQYVDPVIEKQVRRKLDFNLVPLVTGLYLLAFLDRSNIGNAKIAGMEDDLKLSSGDYDWLLTIFYISYIIFEFFALMWKIIPPHMWAAFVVFGWGLVATLQAAIHTWKSEMALRFLMGLFEAGFGPGIPYLLSFFYLRHELGFRCGIFLSAAPLANTFAGALAYGITSGHASVANWRLLFLIEGLPTIVMAGIAWFCLPDSPEKARFLNAEQKAVAKARGVRQVGDEAGHRVGGIVWKDVGDALLDAKNWFTALMYFSCNVSFSSLPVFLPTILDEMGFSSINAQGLTAPPFFLSFLITIGSTYIADRTQQRAFTIMTLSAIGGVGYIMLAVGKSVGVRYAGVFLAAAGIFPSIANILPWVINNQGSDTRRGVGIFILNVVGQCGPLLGTRMYPEDQGPYYVTGQSVCAAFMFFTTLLVAGLRLLLAWENRKLERKEREEFGGVDLSKEEGTENYGRGYRYVL